MWNQNNGNGQGNGYGQQPQNQGYGGGYNGPQDVYGRLDSAKEVGGARFPYIEGGMHKLVLVSLEEFGNALEPKVRALFKTMESRTQPVGGFCVKIWNMTKPPRFPNGVTEADEFVDFCRKLKNAPAPAPIAANIRTLLKERPLEQLARGSMIECNGVPGKQKDANKAPYVRVYWNVVQQSQQDIASMRQRLEQEGIPDTGGGQGQQQTGGPAQLGYNRQTQYQQGAYQNAGGPPPMQQAPQQGYVQQPAMPQQMHPQGYPAQAPAGGAPQGGFLANVPVQGPGPQGGNGGQGGGTW